MGRAGDVEDDREDEEEYGYGGLDGLAEYGVDYDEDVENEEGEVGDDVADCLVILLFWFGRGGG